MFNAKRTVSECLLQSKPKVWLYSNFLKNILVDEIAAELERVKEKTNNLENSLVNNNLLTSCTIQGESTSWYAAPDAIEVEGKNVWENTFSGFNIFLVDLTSKLTKINQINTWLTCFFSNSPNMGCPSALGSNNLRKVPAEDLKFYVQIRRSGSVSSQLETAQKDNLKIHYVVEGPCA